jgi:predicted glycoside hydrolase/deacetylase ChbG (UPF0249 family)
MPPRRDLIINADDLGFAPGVNRGIIEVHEAGSLSSASMMVNTPAFHEAAALVRDRAPTLGVGLHFNLLTGRPLATVPTLANPRTGEFYPLAELSRRALLGRVNADDVRRECDAQIDALEREGISATHIDSHRHTHALPGILPAVVASALAAGIRVVRRPLDRPSLADRIASVKMMTLSAAWRVASRKLDAAGRALLDRSPNFRGIALQGAPDVEYRLLRLLDQLPDAPTEIMLHPGFDDPILAAQDPYRHEREREVAALLSPGVRERLTRGDIRLVTFLDLD